jgi:hypothetical protein
MKLNQVIAVEKGIKSKVTSDVDTIHKSAQKPILFEGMAKTYKKKNDEDQDEVPAQRQHVQMVAARALADIGLRWRELFDVTAQKDYANCVARASIVVDGQTLLGDVPVTYLLFLEKQLTELYTIVSKFPTLDPSEVWQEDVAQGLWRTEPTLTTRTKKVQRPIVLYGATDKHPAQTQLIVEDIPVGTWETTRYSGALPETEHRRLLARIEKAQHAVKAAREQANMVDAPAQAIGEKVFGWLFAAGKN